MSLQAFYVAATIVALVQWWRVREPRLLVVLALLLCLAVAHHQSDWYAARPYHFGAGIAGLALLVMPATRPTR
jgi:hypothetical protein